MYYFRKILSGNYVRKQIDGIWYITAKESDITPQTMEFSDNHKSQLIEDFISLDLESSDEILNFTRKYGPVISMGRTAFKEMEKGLEDKQKKWKKIPPDINIDKNYPVEDTFSFPEIQFKYFHQLIVNLWDLQNDISLRRYDKKLLWNFFCLLFQPYGWHEFYNQYLGVESEMPMAMFAPIYFTITGNDCLGINTQKVKEFSRIILYNKYHHNLRRIVHEGGKIIKKEEPEEYIRFTNNEDVLATLNMMTDLWETKIFDYLNFSFEEVESYIDIKSISYDTFELIRTLGITLICDIINDYISKLSLSVDENLNLIKGSGDSWLISMIFDELVVLCQYYEMRKCKFRKCNKYFIAKKGKEKNYCCKNCADKEIKYRKREGRI